MADTNKKFFLDLGGLSTLWTKMKGTFASKSETEASLASINTELENTGKSLENILNMVLAVSPKEVDNYSAAVASAASVAPGIAIKVNNAEVVDDATKPAGIYLVENTSPVSLVYVGSSDSNISTEELANIISRVAALESSVIKNVSISDGSSTIASLPVVDNTLIITYDDTFEVNSDSVNALTHRAIAAKFGELEALLSSVPKFKVEVIDVLPTDNISFSTIYLLKNTNTSDNNLYTEYLYIQDSANGNHWEKLGEQTITLSDYVTKSDLESAINTAMKDYATKADLEAAKTEILNTVASTYVTKTDAETYVASDEVEGIVLTSIQEGTIGDEITITDDQINALS